MSSKKTLHAYFSKVQAKRKPEGDQSQPADNDHTPLGSAGSKLNQPARITPQTPLGPNKRKAEASLDTKSTDGSASKHRKVAKGPRAEPDRRAKLQALLGETSAQEQSLKVVQERFNWLESQNIKDAAGRKPSDKDYDPRSIQVPGRIWQQLSASQKQYWQVKQHYRDVILFFKIGSFYELYEEDAQIGHDVLGWKLTLTGAGSCRQVGCPASGIDEAVARLTAAGHKVGRMEQVETGAEAKAKRGPKAMIKRTLTMVQSPATLTATVGADSVHLMALSEREGAVENWDMVTQSAAAQFGFAFLDAAAGRFYLGSIVDDAGRANLGAVLTQVAPKELLFARNALSTITTRKLAAPPVPLQLSPVDRADFAEEVLVDAKLEDPAVQKELFGELKISAAVTALGPEALSALAALLKHLRRLKADAQFATSAQMVVPFDVYEGALRLDGPTLQNLEILETQDGGAPGSLLSYLDDCASAGGRRLLRMWLCRPLRSIPAINARLDAVQELSRRPALVAEFRSHLRRLPDLERLLGRVRNSQMPCSGLPAWAAQAAQQKRLAALAAAIEGVTAAAAALWVLHAPAEDSPAEAALLQEAASAMPSCLDSLDTLQGCLNIPAPRPQSFKKGKAPGAAVVLLTDAAMEHELQNASSSCKDAAADAEEARLLAEIRVTTRLVESFNQWTPAWESLEAALSTVDVLMSFAAFTFSPDGPTCRPTLLQPGSGAGGGAVLDVSGLWCLGVAAGAGGKACGRIVPNDLALGTEDSRARSLLLTGPNMGGKSTLLRATCAAQVLAQMGCWVPATACSLTPADRIFTRLGAQDRIVAGESTFLVECNEASTVLRHATAESLVVLDELGRGTSTFDGYAIAAAVLKYLSGRQVRTLFASHYHPLTTEFASSPEIQLGHMTARVAPADANGKPCITFLYQLRAGACPKSYGLQVAQLAGIPSNALKVAKEAGHLLEKKLQASFEGRQGESLAASEVRALGEAVNCLRAVAGL